MQRPRVAVRLEQHHHTPFGVRLARGVDRCRNLAWVVCVVVDDDDAVDIAAE
jgi:hypothetical protein